MPAENLFANLPQPGPEEHLDRLVTTRATRIERIVSHGHATPEGEWYDQEQAEFVVLLAGRARLLFEDSAAAVELAPGDWLEIAAHRRHRVLWTDPAGPAIWLAIHHD